MLQRPPDSRIASVDWVDWVPTSSVRPTAMQDPAPVQVTSWSVFPPGAFGVSMTDHCAPFQCSIRVTACPDVMRAAPAA